MLHPVPMPTSRLILTLTSVSNDVTFKSGIGEISMHSWYWDELRRVLNPLQVQLSQETCVNYLTGLFHPHKGSGKTTGRVM